MRWVLDDDVRRLDRGRVLLGGAPLRFLRLSPAGAAAVGALVAGRAGVPSVLVERLVDRGMAHPVLDPSEACDPAELTVVIPVRDRPEALDRALTALTTALTAVPAVTPATVSTPQPLEDSRSPATRKLQSSGATPRIAIIVVDDGSIGPDAHAAVAARHEATVLRLDRSLGPAGARNAGLAAVTTPFVAFVDSDVTVGVDALARLAGHLGDPTVALVAPRIRHRGAGGALGRYEAVASSLDLGARAGLIRPRTRVAYVPAAAIVARVVSLRQVGGFDESLSVGEDVDLCWRLATAGHRLVYEPSIEALHDGRSTMASWLWRLGEYGTSAALLDARHPGQVPPVAASTWSVAVWGLVVAGHPVLAAVGAIGSAELLARRLDFLDHPRLVAARLVGRGHVGAGRLLAQSLIRPYWPVTAVVALVSHRVRRVAAAAVVIPALVEYLERRPRLDPLRWTALRLADHLAYSVGVWRGAIRGRRFGALRPDLTSWPARTNASGSAGARN